MASYRKRGCTCDIDKKNKNKENKQKKRCTCGATWEFRISVTDPVTGQRIQPERGGFKTKADAEIAAADLLLKYETGALSASAKSETVQSFMQKYLETVLKNEIESQTYEQKVAMMKSYITPEIGKIKLQKLTPMQVQAFINELLNKYKLGAGTIQNVMRLLNQTLNKAVEWGNISRNVASLTSKPTYKPKKFGVWTKEQFEYFLKHSKESRFYPFYLIALTTGMRPGEIQALSWNNVNFKKSSIRVERTAIWTKGEGLHIQDYPKNETSKRNVTIPASVSTYLKTLKISQTPNELNLVIQGIKSPIAYNSIINQTMKEDIVKAGLPIITPHDLRHTHATYLLSPKPFGLGQGIKAVSERLGHAKTMTTLNTYTHVLPNMQESLAQEIEAALNI